MVQSNTCFLYINYTHIYARANTQLRAAPVCRAAKKLAGKKLVERTLKMAGTGFDDPGIYYSDPYLLDDRSENEGELNRTAALKRFKEFLKTFLDHNNCFCYR